MFRRPKNHAQLARLESAVYQLETAKAFLWESGEPMLAQQISAVLNKVRTQISHSREQLGYAPRPSANSSTEAA